MNRLKNAVSGALQSGVVKDAIRAITLNEVKVRCCSCLHFFFKTLTRDQIKGNLVGTDAMGNRYFEAEDEIADRKRWVEYANSDVSHWMQHGFDPSQAPPPPPSPLHACHLPNHTALQASKPCFSLLSSKRLCFRCPRSGTAGCTA